MPRASAPHIVGREALLDYALEDFMGEVTRQKPWRRARYETLLGSLSERIGAELDQPAPVTALNQTRAQAWLQTFPNEQRSVAEEALRDFANYLVSWGWLKEQPLRQPQTA